MIAAILPRVGGEHRLGAGDVIVPEGQGQLAYRVGDASVHGVVPMNQSSTEKNG